MVDINLKSLRNSGIKCVSDFFRYLLLLSEDSSYCMTTILSSLLGNFEPEAKLVALLQPLLST